MSIYANIPKFQLLHKHKFNFSKQQSAWLASHNQTPSLRELLVSVKTDFLTSYQRKPRNI